MSENDHVLILGNDFVHGDWGGECSCGWESKQFDTQEAVFDAWENHCDAVFIDATTRGDVGI